MELKKADIEGHAGHPVAYCAACREEWEFSELCAEWHGDGTVDRERPGTLCPGCGRDLDREIQLHLEECSV